jgi:hypothetical protein
MQASRLKRANASLIRRSVRCSLKPFGQHKARRSVSEHTGGAAIQPKLTHAGGEHLDREHLDIVSAPVLDRKQPREILGAAYALIFSEMRDNVEERSLR